VAETPVAVATPAAVTPPVAAPRVVVTPPVIVAPPVATVRPIAVVPAATPSPVTEHTATPSATQTATPAVSTQPPSVVKVETPKPLAEASPSHLQTAATAVNERSGRKPEEAPTATRRNPSREAEAQVAKKAAWPRHWMIAAAVVLIAITSGVTMLGRLYLFPSTAAAATGSLVVGTNPEGAAVIVDGTHRGATPLSVEGLTPGDHVLELVTESEHRRLPVRITAGGQVSQFLELPKTAPTLGDLQIRTEPSRAKVTVDGHLFGRSPLVIKNLTPGSHMITLESETGSVTEDVTIEAGQTAALFVPLTKPQAGTVSGWISIAAPSDVQVYENQRLLGSSRSDRIMVSVGRHELEIINEALGYRATRTVEVEPGKVAAVRLEWPKGTLALNAIPWAEVWVDGDRIGETPIGSVSVPIGTHEVIFRHPELGERRSSVNVATGAPTKVSVDLRTK
jgi:PEGA domain-containing protein